MPSAKDGHPQCPAPGMDTPHLYSPKATAYSNMGLLRQLYPLNDTSKLPLHLLPGCEGAWEEGSRCLPKQLQRPTCCARGKHGLAQGQTSRAPAVPWSRPLPRSWAFPQPPQGSTLSWFWRDKQGSSVKVLRLQRQRVGWAPVASPRTCGTGAAARSLYRSGTQLHTVLGCTAHHSGLWGLHPRPPLLKNLKVESGGEGRGSWADARAGGAPAVVGHVVQGGQLTLRTHTSRIRVAGLSLSCPSLAPAFW